MRVLLLYAKTPHIAQVALEESQVRKGPREYSRDDVHVPLGIAYLGAVLEKEKTPVRLKDESVHGEEDIKESITWADVVGISALTPNAPRASYWAREVKAIDDTKVVILGGAHATCDPSYFLDDPNVDFIVRWEGEETLVELLRAIESGSRDFSSIGNLVYRTENGPVKTRKRPYITDLDSIPHPARHLLPMDDYFKAMGFKCLIAWSSRGCPFKCTYCNKQMNPCTFRARSPANVVDEMELVVKDYGVEHINFIDDYFIGDKERVLAICDEIKRRGLKVEWSCQVRMDSIQDRRLLRKMRKTGCTKCYIGIESGSQRSLDRMRKEQKVEDVLKGAKMIHQTGMFMKFFLLIGFPWETEEDIRATEEMIYKARPHMIAISILNPMPGTQIYRELKREGKLRENFDLSKHHYYYCEQAFEHEHFTFDQLKAHRDRITDEYIRWFYSPRQIRRRRLEKAAYYFCHPLSALDRLISGI